MLKCGVPGKLFIPFCVLFLLGCAGRTPTDTALNLPQEAELSGTIEALEAELQILEAVQPEEPLPFEGLWISESENPQQTAQVLVITRDSFYTLETYDRDAENLPPAAMEMFAEIRSYDLEKNQITLRIQWFRTNGVMGGFDSPTALVTYALTEDAIQIAISRADDGQFPESPDPRVYFRK